MTESDPDILCFQDTKMSEEAVEKIHKQRFVRRLTRGMHFYYEHCKVQEATFGVCI